MPPAKASEPKPAAEEAEDSRSEAEKNKEAIRDLQIKQLSATKDSTDYSVLLAELLSQYLLCPVYICCLFLRVSLRVSLFLYMCCLSLCVSVLPMRCTAQARHTPATALGGDGARGEGRC